MQSCPAQLTDVIYNAANQSFEALVTIRDGDQIRNYACAINAPIDMSFKDAAQGLSRQALRRHKAQTGTYSESKRHVPAQRSGRAKFDPVSWLESLMHLSGQRAA